MLKFSALRNELVSNPVRSGRKQRPAERPLRRKRAMACEAGAVHDDEATTRGASGRVNQVTGKRKTEPLGDQWRRNRMVTHEGERPRRQGVKAPRGRSALRGRKEPEGKRRQAVRPLEGDGRKLNEPYDRLLHTNH